MSVPAHVIRLAGLSTVLLAVAACSSGGGAVPPPTTVVPPPIVDPKPVDSLEYSVLTTRTLDADGDMVGLDAYDLIRDFGGPNPIEAPDLYPINHPDVRHIYEDNDAVVGDHFVFIIHRDIDIDRDRVENDDRQRNEIKTYNSSEEAVKGYENETFVFRWKFRINEGMEVSTRFTHLFQLKAVGGPDSQPILTISGAERSGSDGIEVRHSPLQDHTVLERTDWSAVTGEWLDAYCRVTFSDSGGLRLIVTRMSDDGVIFDIDETGLDLWRGEDPSHFVRPKWGIYRSILDLDNLRPDEENVRFANFSISEVMPSS
ncbi:MAG: hypothetical protein AAFN50_11215 [Pseudomonadota bacterium]